MEAAAPAAGVVAAVAADGKWNGLTLVSQWCGEIGIFTTETRRHGEEEKLTTDEHG